jgi:hypothetical protein
MESEHTDKILIFCGHPTDADFDSMIPPFKEVEMHVEDSDHNPRYYWIEEEIAMPFLKKTVPEEEYWYIKILLEKFKLSKKSTLDMLDSSLST